jgi:hypothetical protein
MAKILKTVILNSLLLMILLYPLALTAEQITPSERVKDNINIRSAPSADSKYTMHVIDSVFDEG